MRHTAARPCSSANSPASSAALAGGATLRFTHRGPSLKGRGEPGLAQWSSQALDLGGWDSVDPSRPQVASGWQAGRQGQAGYSPCRSQSPRDNTACWTTSRRPLRCSSCHWTGARRDMRTESPGWQVFREQKQITVIIENPDTCDRLKVSQQHNDPMGTSWSSSYSRLHTPNVGGPQFHPQHQIKYK